MAQKLELRASHSLGPWVLLYFSLLPSLDKNHLSSLVAAIFQTSVLIWGNLSLGDCKN